jgi:hypothetical protein
MGCKFAADDGIDYIADNNTIYAFGNYPSYLIAECCSRIFYQTMLLKYIMAQASLGAESFIS